MTTTTRERKIESIVRNGFTTFVTWQREVEDLAILPQRHTFYEVIQIDLNAEVEHVIELNHLDTGEDRLIKIITTDQSFSNMVATLRNKYSRVWSIVPGSWETLTV